MRAGLELSSRTCAGVDVTSGKIPGKMEMLRLLMKTDIRESAMKVATAFQEAGIDMQSKVGILPASIREGSLNFEY